MAQLRGSIAQQLEPAMHWNIVPYVGVGPLTFGMTQTEVAAILGPPEAVQPAMSAGASPALKKKYRNDVVEHRIGKGAETIKPSIEYNKGRLVSIELHDLIKGVAYNGINLFELPKPEATRRLTELSSHYAVDHEDLVFLDLGIALSNDESWEYAPSINIFAKGQFDEIIAAGVTRGDTKIVRK
jgi:hypothetical protein